MKSIGDNIKKVNARVIPDNELVKTKLLTFYPLRENGYYFINNIKREDHICRTTFYARSIEIQRDAKIPADKESYLIIKENGIRYYSREYWQGNGLPSTIHIFVGNKEMVNTHCKELAREDRINSIKKELKEEVYRSRKIQGANKK